MMQIMSGILPGTYVHQCVSEHRYSAIGKHLTMTHRLDESKSIDYPFQVLKKCISKFDCLIYEMIFIKDIKPLLNTLKLT